MEPKELIGLYEAYQQVYEPQQLTEEVEIATEYFYQQGFNDNGIGILIEQLGVDEFSDWVFEIVEDYKLYEAAKRGGTVLKGAELRKSRKAQAGRTAEFSRPTTSGRAAKKAYKVSSSQERLSARNAAAQAAKTSQTPTPKSTTPAQTKQGIGSRISSALQYARKRAGEDTKKVARAAGTAAAVVHGAGIVAHRAGQEFGKSKMGQRLRGHIDRAMREENDYILEYLVSEGYADTDESALVIMSNMSEEWRQNIMERDDEPGEEDDNPDVKRHNRSLRDKSGKQLYPSGIAGYSTKRYDRNRDPRHGSNY